MSTCVVNFIFISIVTEAELSPPVSKGSSFPQAVASIHSFARGQDWDEIKQFEFAFLNANHLVSPLTDHCKYFTAFRVSEEWKDLASAWFSSQCQRPLPQTFLKMLWQGHVTSKSLHSDRAHLYSCEDAPSSTPPSSPPRFLCHLISSKLFFQL